MRYKIFTILSMTLLFPVAALAATMGSPSYSNAFGDTPSGAGNGSSPAYSATPGIVGNAFRSAPAIISPNYTIQPPILGKTVVRDALPTGDINNDNSVTIADALLALQVSVGTVPQASSHLTNGDVAPFVDGKPVSDGVITVADALIILRKVVGLVSW